MKKNLITILAVIACVCTLFAFTSCNATGISAEEKQNLENYVEELKSYMSAYTGKGMSAETKLAAMQFEADITGFTVNDAKTYEENKQDVDGIFENARSAVSAGFMPKYDATADISNYLNDGDLAGTLKFTDLGGSLLGSAAALLGAGRGSYSAGEIVKESVVKGETKDAVEGFAIFTAEEFVRINALTDAELKAKMLNVKSVNELIRSSVVSFCSDRKFVITNHYTQLGVDYFKASRNENYVVDQEYYVFGKYTVAETSYEGTNDYGLGVVLDDGSEMDFVFNAASGVVSRRNYVFDRITYAVIDEASNAVGGYDFDTTQMETDDYVFSKGVKAFVNVRYGDRKMKAFTPDQITDDNRSQATLEEENPSILTDRETLTLYAPAQADIDAHKENGNGVILLIHGGSWVSGEKESMLAYARYYASIGYFAVAINHTYGARMYEDGEVVTFAHIQNEINMAMIKVKEMSDENGWNINKCATYGYSSGSHLAAWYAYDMGNEDNAPIPVVCTFSMV
ncbi:MAG: hypothetical protein IKZ28_02075, partial [Clostridia bacterium]|nr:hypothetical protein [Clostridia bacterium]